MVSCIERAALDGASHSQDGNAGSQRPQNQAAEVGIGLCPEEVTKNGEKFLDSIDMFDPAYGTKEKAESS
jgi:hypothetical protein